MKKIRNIYQKIDKKINWSLLKSFGEHKAVASMYIWLFTVPLIANALNGLENKFPVTVFSHTFEFSSTLPFSWQAFFYSALAFTMANLIRIVFCPKIISDHSDYATFINSKKDHLHLVEYEKEFEKPFQVFAREKEFMDKYGTSEDKVSKAFWDIHKNANNIHMSAQYICFTLYFIGTILIGFVIIQNIVTVAAYL